jgi:GNAT superfamily N-acetyltransferase
MLESYLPALEMNMFEFYTRWGRAPGCERFESADFIRFSTGISDPIFNGVFRAQLTPEAIDSVIEENLAYFKSKQVPCLWFIGPLTHPSALGVHLERHGFTLDEEDPCMVVDLQSINEELPVPDGLTIRVVQDGETLKTWGSLVAEANGASRQIQDQLSVVEADLGLDLNRLRYLGYRNGSPVASSALVIHAGVAGVYAVSTLPAARRQGVGTAMTLAPLRDARKLGLSLGTLQASRLGYPLYRRIGFQDVFKVSMYLWEYKPSL